MEFLRVWLDTIEIRELLSFLIWHMDSECVALSIEVVSLPCHSGECIFSLNCLSSIFENFLLDPIIVIHSDSCDESIRSRTLTQWGSTRHKSAIDSWFRASLWSSSDSPVWSIDDVWIVLECPTKDLRIKILRTGEIICLDLKMKYAIAHI